MAILNNILNWTKSLPLWQRDACRRLFLKEAGLENTDYSELYTLLKKARGIDRDSTLEPEPLTEEHLPIEPTASETVTLLKLHDLENVNRISSDNALKFSETGMTVIYGGNGSGKSGYARVMKRACRARDQSERIYPNANDPTASGKEPTAKFEIKAGSEIKEIKWSRDIAPPECLSTISVFDSKCARSYITDEKDVAYLPYGLDIVENLANRVLPKLSGMLDEEIRSIDVSTTGLEYLSEESETEVGKIINGLSSQSDVGAIKSLGTLTEDDTGRIVELRSVLNETNPLVRAQEVQRSSARLKTYASKLAETMVDVSNPATLQLKYLIEKRNAAELAEKKAAETLQAGEELLAGTGGQAWQMLFDAARKYSTEAAYPGEEFPPSAKGMACPLCQEELPEAGLQRLKRFDDYIKNDIAKTASEVREQVEIAIGRIRTANLNIGPEIALSDELKSLDESVLQSIADFQDTINSRRDFMLRCLEASEWGGIPDLIESPKARIRQIAAQQLRLYRTLVKAADEENRKKIEKELKELSTREKLAERLQVVLELVERMKKRTSLEQCKPSLITNTISMKSREFAADAVTQELKNALDQEFSELGVDYIETRLKERSEKGKVFHRILLALPTNTQIKIEEILSEGEQRAIALASFFAELSLANHSCGIVFDDPVSSLDHHRRCNVARRLVREANIRQVIIFTHDTSFLGQLRESIENDSVPNSMLFLEWQNNSPGHVNDGLNRPGFTGECLV